jgi:putative membrane protein
MVASLIPQPDSRLLTNFPILISRLKKQKSPAEWLMLGSFGLYCFVFPWAILLLSLDWMPFGMEWMSSLLLAALGLASAGWLWTNFGSRGLFVAWAIFALGIALEYLGVTTGFPFGTYTYTDVLVPQLPGSLPLAIGFAWLTIVVSGLFTARWLFTRTPARGPLLWSIVGALLSVGLDLLLEPVAYLIKGYWLWQSGSNLYYGIPLTNFLAWLVAAFLMNLLVSTLLRPRSSLLHPWLPVSLFVMNATLFAVVNLAHGYWIAALVGTILLGLIAARYLLSNSRRSP